MVEVELKRCKLCRRYLPAYKFSRKGRGYCVMCRGSSIRNKGGLPAIFNRL